MNTLAFTKHLKTKGLDKVYPNNIPTGLNGVTGVYSYDSSMNRYLTHGTMRLQFLTVDKDLNTCEQRANEIANWLLQNDISGNVVEDFEILNLSILQLSPIYVGMDDEKRYKWSFNIELDIKKFKLN